MSSRILRWGHLAHNKFVVVCNANEVPESVWTGNVTWTGSGLCTRSNAAVTIVSPELAQRYLTYWTRLASTEGNRHVQSFTKTDYAPVSMASPPVVLGRGPPRYCRFSLRSPRAPISTMSGCSCCRHGREFCIC